MRKDELILYRNFARQDILDAFCSIFDDLKNGRGYSLRQKLIDVEGTPVRLADDDALRQRLSEATGALIRLSDDFGFEGNLWHCFLAYLLCNNENPFSCACEIRGRIEGSMNAIALHDFKIFRELFGLDIMECVRLLDLPHVGVLSDYTPYKDNGKTFNKRIRDRICELARALAGAGSDEEFMSTVTEFYREFGVGKYGLNKAFRIRHESEGEQVVIEPIRNIKHVNLDDLVGYESAKAKLVENTEAFLAGRPANNCLLYGDAGTGKSTSIKAISNMYYDRGLRIIEVYKHQFRDLNDVISQIKDRNYRFILYMDDLSFEEFETDYKYLKAVIEGGLEKKPDNILIYATSNRRHLVRETFRDKNDRDEELHSNDTVQEKLSLANRFGVSIYFGRPDKKEFQNIVKTLAEKHKVAMPAEELYLEANKWELSHGGLSGRTAQQFIDHILGTVQKQ